jgi:hypothetical protein
MKILTRQPNDRPKTIRLTVKSEVEEVSVTRRTIISTITTDCLDRYREAIVTRGIALDNFRANPIVLWCHYGTAPIGKSLWIKRQTRDGKSLLLAKTLFAKTELADEIFMLYVDKFLNGWSIGACPDWSTYSPPTDEEIKSRPEYKKARALIRKCELVEYSACSIPANPEALGNDNETEKKLSAPVRRQIEASEHWSDLLEDSEEDSGLRTQDSGLRTQDSEGIRPQSSVLSPSPMSSVFKGNVLPPLPAPLPALVGRTFAQALEATHRDVARLTTRAAGEAAALQTIDRLKGRV